MTKINLPIILGRPNIQEEEIDEVSDTLENRWVGTGPKTRQFEDEFAEYVGVPYAIGTSSGSAALHLSLIASDIGPGDEVITTPMTFVATAAYIHHVGATPVFADIDPYSLNLDPEKVEEKITLRTKAIMPVHFAGNPCDMDPLEAIAKDHELKIIEDAAHAIGATYGGVKIGALGNLTCFSFYPTKNLTTGEGGMVTTRDLKMAERISRLSNHGQSKDAHTRFNEGDEWGYEIPEPGFKYNLIDLHSAIGLHQLRRLESNLARREQIWSTYNTSLKDLPLEIPPEAHIGNRHARHLYTLRLNLDELTISRNEFKNLLRDVGIHTGAHHYSPPVHLQGWCRTRYDYKEGDFPIAEDHAQRTVSLPLSDELTDGEVDYVVHEVKDVCERYSR